MASFESRLAFEFSFLGIWRTCTLGNSSSSVDALAQYNDNKGLCVWYSPESCLRISWLSTETTRSLILILTFLSYPNPAKRASYSTILLVIRILFFKLISKSSFVGPIRKIPTPPCLCTEDWSLNNFQVTKLVYCKVWVILWRALSRAMLVSSMLKVHSTTKYVKIELWLFYTISTFALKLKPFVKYLLSVDQSSPLCGSFGSIAWACVLPWLGRKYSVL